MFELLTARGKIFVKWDNCRHEWYSVYSKVILPDFDYFYSRKGSIKTCEAWKWPTFWHAFCWKIFFKFILIQISLNPKFISKDPSDKNCGLNQVMGWCWTGNKPLTEAMTTPLLHTCMHCQVCVLITVMFPSRYLFSYQSCKNSYIFISGSIHSSFTS